MKKLSEAQLAALKLVSGGPLETLSIAGGNYYDHKRTTNGVSPRTADVLKDRGFVTLEFVVKGMTQPRKSMSGQVLPAVPRVVGLRMAITDAGRAFTE